MMNASRVPISKTLVGLAVVLLPLQQALALACFCPQRDAGVRSESEVERAGCCTKGSPVDCSCCSASPAVSDGSKPCACPSGCGSQDKTNVAEPLVATEASAAEDGLLVAVARWPMASADRAGKADLARKTPAVSESGAARCVVLCRFTL